MVSLGLIAVTSAGTPQALWPSSLPCDAVNILPMKGPTTANVGNIYIGTKGMNKTSLVNVLYILASGQPATTVRSRATFKDDVNNYYIDADNSGDGAVISFS